MQLEPDTFVFSEDKILALTYEEQDMFKLKKGSRKNPYNNTPSRVQGRNVPEKEYNRLVHNLGDAYKDEISKRSFAMMLDKYGKMIGGIAFLQEAKKKFLQGVPPFAEGTAPVYDTDVKDGIQQQQQQFMKYGGSISNPYLDKMQKGGWGVQRRSNSDADDRMESAVGKYDKSESLNFPISFMSPYEAKDSSFIAPILDLLPDAIIWVYPVTGSNGMVEDFQIGYSNRSADAGINHPKGSLAGLCVLKDGVPSMESAQANFKHFLQVYQTGEPSEYTFYAHHSGLQYETRRVTYEGGILSTTRDRRAQREAERKEQEKTLLLDNILTHSSNGIAVGEMIWDEMGNIIDIKTLVANDAAVRFTGISKEDYLTKTGAELDPSFTHSAYFQMCVKCMETGEPFITQYFLAGVGAWLEVSVSKMDDNRQIYIFTDVTPIKEAQVALENSARQLTTIINTTQAGFFMISPIQDEGGTITDFRFTMVNQVMAAFVGAQAEDMVGQPASLKFETYKTNGLFELLREVYLTGVQQQFDIHYSGKIVDTWVNMRITKIGDQVLGTFTDINQLKTLQLQLEQNIEELKRSNAYLEEFAHAASHDLKEPIRKIQTFSERLQSSLTDRLTEVEVGLFQRMQSATRRMNLLVEDLLTYSQFNEKPLQKEAVDLNEKLQSVLSDLDVQIEEKKAVIQVHSLPIVNGYRRQLQQLFQNLISNALKYSKRDIPPRIVISSRSISGADLPEHLHAAMWEKHYYLIEVQDNGIGFEQEHANRIFKMFQRLHGRSEYEGTGIGLSIVRKVIDNHQGYIWAQSRSGEGATFSFLLPKE